MKDIKPRLIELFKEGNCTPQISVIAKKLKEPSTTIHYNIKRLEEEGAIISYKAVFDYKKINEGLCTYVFVNVGSEDYGNPEKIIKEIVNDSRVESIDVVTGEYELLLKLRTKDIDAYYQMMKEMIKKYHFSKTTSVTSLKSLKTEFVKIE
ncbi:Lrp/AsnC ligand binding domain-containing protein [Candidatus Pacearchaeota archaeon]|nr:Lrp/AsnC ligand binding domain-containing protein [Candidatus Pacearchaeota archaeon]